MGKFMGKLLIGLTLIVAAGSIFLWITYQPTQPQATTQSVASTSQKAPQKAKQVHSSTPSVTELTEAQKITLVLMTAAGGQDAYSANQMVNKIGRNDFDGHVTATLTQNGVIDPEVGARVYSLSPNHTDLAPIIYLNDDDAYVFGAQSGVPLSYMQENAAKFSLKALYTQYGQNKTFKAASQLLTVTSNTEQAADSQ